MSTPFTKSRLLPIALAVMVVLLVLAPSLAFAADFVPLAPIPNLDTSEDATLGSYINSVFLLIISVSAMLAVIRIVIGGFQYMTQTASVTKTASAVNTIRDAAIGLLLLLGSFIILSTLNREIVDLQSLNFSGLQLNNTTLEQAEKFNRDELIRRMTQYRAENELGEEFATYEAGKCASDPSKELAIPATLFCKPRGNFVRPYRISETQDCTGTRYWGWSCIPKSN